MGKNMSQELIKLIESTQNSDNSSTNQKKGFFSKNFKRMAKRNLTSFDIFMHRKINLLSCI